MNFFRILLLLFIFQSAVFATNNTTPCEQWPSWVKSICLRPYQTWTQGNNELYLPFYAWHNRYAYNKIYLSRFNENAWGAGLGKSFYDEKGDWHGLFAFAFLDSHRYLEPVVGYAFLKTAHLSEHVGMGLGYSLLITQRPDVFHGVPFPGALPWVSMKYRRVSLAATYIPGVRDAGNVLFLVAKILF